jgi:hypothetical protein
MARSDGMMSLQRYFTGLSYGDIGHRAKDQNKTDLWWNWQGEGKSVQIVKSPALGERGLQVHQNSMPNWGVTHYGRVDHAKKRISLVRHEDWTPTAHTHAHVTNKVHSKLMDMYPGYEVHRMDPGIFERAAIK